MNILNRIAQETIGSNYFSSCSQVLASSNPYARSNKVGHITASGLVIKDGHVLLIHHPYIKQWFQPGGHIDDGEMPLEAAIREVFEETGVVCEPANFNHDPIDIDVHAIPANPNKGEDMHLHIDLLFLLRVLQEQQASEDIQKAWIPFDQIKNARLLRALKHFT